MVGVKKLDMAMASVIGHEEKILSMYSREVLYLIKCHHPFVIKYMDSFKDKDNFYIVTQYAEKGNL
jgi:serine/threonine protein kinase